MLAFYYRATVDRPGRLRRWFNRHDFRAMYLTVGFCLHLGIELTLEVGSFFGGMMVLYAACLHPNEWRAWWLVERTAKAPDVVSDAHAHMCQLLAADPPVNPKRLCPDPVRPDPATPP